MYSIGTNPCKEKSVTVAINFTLKYSCGSPQVISVLKHVRLSSIQISSIAIIFHNYTVTNYTIQENTIKHNTIKIKSMLNIISEDIQKQTQSNSPRQGPQGGSRGRTWAAIRSRNPSDAPSSPWRLSDR
jgi:hypothetical protein